MTTIPSRSSGTYEMDRIEVGERAAEALVTPGATMTVRVRDRSAEAPWGVGLTSPIVRRVTISAACRVCGGKRGEPSNLNQYDDGAHYSVDVWTNDCGHIDSYAAVVKEARELAQAGEQL